MIATLEAAAPGAVAAEPFCPDEAEEAIVFPKLHILVPGSERNIADLVVPMAALILGPALGDATKPTLHYFEYACLSSSTAHAVAGALVEYRLQASLSVKLVGGAWQYVNAPEAVRIQDAKLAVHGWERYVHHIAVLDRSSDLLVADSDEALWRKLRTRMDLPTLEGWGAALLPQIRKSGLVRPAFTYGLAEGLAAYVLSRDASQTFDGIVSAHVRDHGLTAGTKRRTRGNRATLRRAS